MKLKQEIYIFEDGKWSQIELKMVTDRIEQRLCCVYIK